MFEAILQIRVYYILLLIIVLFNSIDLYSHPCKFFRRIPYNHWKEVCLFVFCLLFIGIREWWIEDVFADSIRYGESYQVMKFSDLQDAKDFGFTFFSLFCKLMGFSTDIYFLICAFLYLFPLYKVAKKIGGSYSFFLFLVCVSSFSFYNYGVNGVRNGIATSFLLLSIVNYKNYFLLFIYALIGLLFHLSVALPFIMTLIVLYSKINEKYCLLIWGVSILIGVYATDVFKDLILEIGWFDSRTSQYLGQQNTDMDLFSREGFRWDFLIYSSFPILLSLYCVYKKNVKNEIYIFLLKIYLLTNSAWLVINAVPFSNRFAYLSWFMMPVLIFYPFYLMIQRDRRFRKMAFCFLVYYLFTFSMCYK